MIDPGPGLFERLQRYSQFHANARPGGSNTILNSVGTNNANGFTGRVDQNFGASNTMWFRYSFLNGTSIAPNHIMHSCSTTRGQQKLRRRLYPHVLSDAHSGRDGGIFRQIQHREHDEPLPVFPAAPTPPSLP